jgi:hypothetical protein
MSKLLQDRLLESLNPIFIKYNFSYELQEKNYIYSILVYTHLNLQVKVHIEEMERYYYYEIFDIGNEEQTVFSSPNRLTEHSVLELLTPEQMCKYKDKQRDTRKIEGQISNDQILLDMVIPNLISKG